MSPLLEILQNFSTLFFAFFSILLILCYHYVWLNIAKNFPQNSQNSSTQIGKPEVSVLVPFRNEKNRILPLLNSLTNIPHCPNLEFIFIDDHSEDDTSNLVLNHHAFNLHSCKLLKLKNGVYGKKNALQEGIFHARNNTILTTDADCELQPYGIHTLFDIYNHTNAALLIGPVLFKTHTHSLLESYQKIENTALVALGFQQNKSLKPTMANGANLMFNKSIFLELEPFKNNLQVAGGDDIFTLEAFFLNHPKQVIGTTNPITAVYTHVLSSFSELWQQRIRWVKKTAHQNTQNTKKSQIFLAVFYMIFWGLTAYSVVFHHYEIAAILWIGKSLSDILNLQIMFNYFLQPIHALEILGASIIQNFFLPLLGMASPFQKTKWKNRTY